ncbi:hypothetical protein L596_019330 [Steinernema carpocapsae]|uniref:Uncharacterized protein n=1 Tax=Steinernema carpocapsae TaxID=34508 RepID=A0A4U5MQ61_STECR|nr:hypothetical protein L596_019330 [Steinernema carpocapsae]
MEERNEVNARVLRNCATVTEMSVGSWVENKCSDHNKSTKTPGSCGTWDARSMRGQLYRTELLETLLFEVNQGFIGVIQYGEYAESVVSKFKGRLQMVGQNLFENDSGKVFQFVCVTKQKCRFGFGHVRDWKVMWFSN